MNSLYKSKSEEKIDTLYNIGVYLILIILDYMNDGLGGFSYLWFFLLGYSISKK